MGGKFAIRKDNSNGKNVSIVFYLPFRYTKNKRSSSAATTQIVLDMRDDQYGIDHT